MFLKMAKVEIVGPKTDIESVLSYIHHLGVLDIEDLTHKFDADAHIRRMQLNDETRTIRDRLETALVKINSFITALEPAQIQKGREGKNTESLTKLKDADLVGEADGLIASIEEATQQLTNEKRELELEQNNLGKYLTMFAKIAPLAKELIALKGFDNIMLLVEKKNIDVLELIDEELAQITHDQFQLITTDIDNDTAAAMIVYNSNYAKPVHDFLWVQHVNEVRLPEELAKLSYDQAMAKMKKRRGEIPKLLAEVGGKIQALASRHGERLVSLSRAMTDRLAELHIVNHLGATDYTFVIQGWMPKKRLPRIAETLKDKFGSKLIVEEMGVTPEELKKAPIKYQNPLGIKAFEPIMGFFGTPQYGTVDPTPFLAFFFPLFFGIILGDMGYAMVVFGLAFWLRARFKEIPLVQSLSVILTLCAISSFFFGFIYGEFFGDLFHRLHVIVPKQFWGITFPVDREKDALVAVLVLTIALGAAHMVLGLVLGVINAAREKSRRHVVEKVGLLVMLFGLMTMAAGFSNALPVSLKTPATAMIVVALPMLFYGGGILAVLEVLGVIGNVLSYARIMALGLVSVVLAGLANQAGGSFENNLILGILVASLIHAVNIAIHLFTPSVHALRLNFVEFFGKFYESGGREYKPFRKGEIL